MGLRRSLEGLFASGRGNARSALAAVEDLAENRAPLTEYQAYADLVKSAAPKLSPSDRKRLAFRIVSLGRLVPERPWEHLPDGYVPEGLIMVRARSGSHRVNAVHDRRVARLWLLPIYARALGRVVAEILRRDVGTWSLEDLEALLDASGGPFADYSRQDSGWYRTTAYDYRYWPWGADAFAERLADHEGKPGFGRVLERFLDEVYAWAYQAGAEAVPRVLALAGRHEGGLRLLFERLEAIEEERLSFMEEMDLARVENALRFRVSAQVLYLLGRTHRLVRELWVPNEGGVYGRVIRAVGCRGVDEYVAEEDRKHHEGLGGGRGSGINDAFTGEDRSVLRDEEYLAEIRSLADHPPERSGSPRISSKDFLSHFAPEQLKQTYFGLEDPYPTMISRRWRALWLATGRDPEATAAMLGAFYEYPELKTLSAVPPETWWERWQEAVSLINSEVVREACEAFLRAGIGKRTSYFSSGLDAYGSPVNFAAVYGMSAVAGPETCEKLVAVGREPRTYGEPAAIAAARALERIGSPEALSGLQTLKVRVKNKNVLRPIEECLGRLAEQRGVGVETLADLSAESFGIGPDGVREWTLGDYVGEVRLTEGGKVEKGFRNTKTGKALRSMPKAAKEAAPEASQEITATTKKLREGYAVQKARLEAAMVSGRAWNIEDWSRAFVENPLLNHLACRLVWSSGSGTLATPDGEGGWMGVDGESVEVGSTVRLAHPVTLEAGDLAAWRRLVVSEKIVQPFKQIFRETYVLTPAEEETGDYSNRFAAHVVNHRRLYALLKERGWSGMYMLGEHESPAHKDYPEQMTRALFFHSGEMDIGNVDGSDTFVLDHVWFVRLSRHGRQLHGGETLPLAEVDPAVFSEAMRDVDLFVAAAGVGMDPNWEEWETRRARDAAVWEERRAAYEQEQAATADERAALLGELLPALGLGDGVRLEGRFALVQGEHADYRIHLGSGNVHTEPQGRYICIVPARRETEDLYVPFEESDLKTAEILSKVLMLANDGKIKDASILRQLG